MANYVLLYTGGGGMAASEAERAKVMEAWGAWFGKLGDALVDGGNPFSGKTKTIAKEGKTTDGDGGMMHSGYSIVMADSLSDAVEIAKGCPVLAGGATITVYETFNAM